ncbi:MAG: hypothetical protein RL186_1193 [Pseudomonadota bacterium]|jgi:PhnB protein
MTENVDFGQLMRGVIPYLTIKGADAAMAFYMKAFGAQMRGQVTRAPDSGKILNVALEINGGAIMLVDYFDDRPDGPAAANNGYLMQIVTPDGQAFWDRAIAAGCTIVAPFEVQFWGDTWGQCVDPFGVSWAINQPCAHNQELAKNL